MFGLALALLVAFLAWPSSDASSKILDWLREVASKTKRISALKGPWGIENAEGFKQIGKARLATNQWRKVGADGELELWRNDGSEKIPGNIQFVTAEAALGAAGWALVGRSEGFAPYHTQMAVDDRWLAVVEEATTAFARPEKRTQEGPVSSVTPSSVSAQAGVAPPKPTQTPTSRPGDPLGMLAAATKAGLKKAATAKAVAKTSSAVTGRVKDFPPGGHPLDLAKAFSDTVKGQ